MKMTIILVRVESNIKKICVYSRGLLSNRVVHTMVFIIQGVRQVQGVSGQGAPDHLHRMQWRISHGMLGAATEKDTQGEMDVSGLQATVGCYETRWVEKGRPCILPGRDLKVSSMYLQQETYQYL